MEKQTFKTSDGVEIAYYIDDFTDPWKPAETLVMLHPAMSSSRRFYSMVPGLARRFRVIRVDTRGHGASQIPPENLPVNKERLMKDALELLDHLKLAKTHVIGVSAGGYSAQQLAIHHPDRLKSLVLFCSTPGFKGEPAGRRSRSQADRVGPGRDLQKRSGVSDPFYRLLDRHRFHGRDSRDKMSDADRGARRGADRRGVAVR